MRRNTLAAATLACGLALATLAGCSREKIDWKSAESADTVEAYDHFIERHPDSALVTQARTRVEQLNEDRDWKRATGADTAEAYRQFLAQHESGKWAEEARIRIENFSLDGTANGPAKPAADAQPTVAATSPSLSMSRPATVTPPMAKPASASPDAPSTTKPAVTAGASPPAPPKPSSAPAAPASTAAQQKHLAAASGASAAAKSAATAKPAASAEAAGASSFGIQLGAFRTQDAALKNWKQLRVKFDSDLHGLFAHAVPVKQASGQLFRLQAPVGEESRARAICASLSKQAQPCVVVLPE